MTQLLRSRLPALRRVANIRLASSGANDTPGLRDPWLLPAQHDPPDTAKDPVTYTPHPLDGSREAFEELSTLRSRLVYQTRKRGTLETGLLLSTFATSDRINKWNEEELKELDRLMAIPEWTIYYWAVGKQEPPEGSEWRTSKILGEFSIHFFTYFDLTFLWFMIYRRTKATLQERGKGYSLHA